MEEINNEPAQEPEVQEDNAANKRKPYFMYGIGILVTLVCISGGLFYFFKYKSQSNSGSSINSPIQEGADHGSDQAIFYNLDEFVVNLNKVNNQNNFLKVALTFQFKGQENTAKIEDKLPIIKDAFQIYLRELKAGDIQGSAGIFLLKQELLLRVNKILYPIKIEDVLFRDLLIQ